MASTAVELLRRRFGGKKDILPQGYTQLNYIESYNKSGVNNQVCAYINTGIIPNDTTEIEISFYTSVVATHFGQEPFSAYSFDDTQRFMFSTYKADATTTGYAYMGTQRQNLTSSQFTVGDHIISYKNKQYVLDGNVILNVTSSFTKTMPTITLFIKHKAPDIFSGNQFNGKIYYCKIWKNGSLVRNFIPCKNSSNIVGLFDTKSQTFFVSPNGYNFIGS